MIAPIAAVIFAISMALSLSVEADSFFHVPSKASAEPEEAEAPTDGGSGTARDGGRRD